MSKQRLFRFKKFTIDHSGSTMKIGTDGVLLGAWTKVGEAKDILDIGTGSGVIALMMAQRSRDDASIEAVEIESADAEQARQNVLNSPWPDKVHIFCTPIQSFASMKKYDLIVSNPPFFSNSFEPPDLRRVRTRHTTALSFIEIVEIVDRLLSGDGTFNVILPPTEGCRFVALAINRELFCTRKWLFKTRKEKKPERWLLEFSRINTGTEEGEILLYDEGDIWTEAYSVLTRDFYLDPQK